MPNAIVTSLAVGIVTLVARWFLVANAIAGLRGRELITRVGLVPQEPTHLLVADRVGEECRSADADR